MTLLAQKRQVLFLLSLLFFGILDDSMASLGAPQEKVRYKTQMGHCPARSVGNLALNLLEEFEKKRSLREVKAKITKEKLSEKHFLSSYEITYDPSFGELKFLFDCPRPLMKVQVYQEKNKEMYRAILVENGKLFDPTYEVILKEEQKLNQSLPFLALPLSLINKDIPATISQLWQKISPHWQGNTAELILNDDEELIMIFSVEEKAVSAFFGKGEWSEKIHKLEKMLNHMVEKKNIPSLINITNSKKVVVKF